LGALLVVLILAFGLALLPQMWVKGVLQRHSVHRPDFPGTGGEFARHLLDEMNLVHVNVEETKALGDHYDPEAKVVRLTPQHFDGRSLSAIVVAAHEVGHAMQDATDYRPLHARTRLAKQARTIERFGMAIMLATPIAMLIFKSPHVVVLQLLVGMLILGSTIFMHALTLPVEFDASFRRALPVLKAGRYIGDRDLSAARQILSAAAFTYVAAAAMSLLDVARWLRVLRI
jgi:Zn-dependent membrane protease YugP